MRPAWFRNRVARKRSGHVQNYKNTAIAKSAVEAFLDRERDDFNWIKDVWAWDLRKHVYSDYNAFHTKPRLAQLAGFAIGMEYHDFLFNYGCGVGKTKLLLDLIRYHRFHSRAWRWLVLVPNVINLQSWEDQIHLHAPDLTYELLLGTRQQRHALVNERVDIQILNYAGLQSYMTQHVAGEIVKDEAGNRYREAGSREINRYAAQNFAEMFDGVVFDESHEVGNRDAKRYWLCRRLSRACRFKYASTATLFNTDPTMMWPQFDLVDGGYTLGESLGLFRAGFFNEKQSYWRTEYVFDKSKEALLNRCIRHRSLRYTAEECGDVPRVNRIRERLTWDEEQLAFYTRVRSECRLGRIGKVKLNPHAYTRMRQICSGYVGYSTDDDGKAKHVFKHSPKLERLLQVIREMPQDTKIMIFHQYVFTGDLICDALEKRKIKVAKLFGPMKDAAKQYRMFLEDDKCRAISAQYRRVAGGNPHEVASFMYFFESPPDPLTRTQVEEREVRPGQPKKVFMYDCIMPNSFEEPMLDALAEGKDFHEAITEGEAYI